VCQWVAGREEVENVGVRSLGLACVLACVWYVYEWDGNKAFDGVSLAVRSDMDEVGSIYPLAMILVIERLHA